MFGRVQRATLAVRGTILKAVYCTIWYVLSTDRKSIQLDSYGFHLARAKKSLTRNKYELAIPFNPFHRDVYPLLPESVKYPLSIQLCLSESSTNGNICHSYLGPSTHLTAPHPYHQPFPYPPPFHVYLSLQNPSRLD